MQSLYEMYFKNTCYSLSKVLKTPEKVCDELFTKCENLPLSVHQCISHLPAANLPRPNLIFAEELGTWSIPTGTEFLALLGLIALATVLGYLAYLWEKRND